jgi:pyrroloquinoline quinone biosynthesis protein B
MRIRLLGTAAGGGVPQWNCNCAVCRESRGGNGRVQARTQSSVAISADNRRWFLLNASPDLRAQIESFPPLHPPAGNTRGSPIEAVLLTNADLDHTLGLLLLREGEKLAVHATGGVRASLTQGTSIASTLESFCGVDWITPPETLSPLRGRDGSLSGLSYQAIPLPGRAPRFMQRAESPATGHVVGYRIVDENTGGRLLFLPDLAAITDAVRSSLAEADAVLFDGTFWSENEMRDRGAGSAAASDMGHLPISGPAGSLKVLAQLKMKNRIYVHLNNTNPVLIEDSSERAAVVAAGCVVGADGMEINI